MEVDALEKILIGVGAKKLRARFRKLTCCCLLARWTHRSGSDSHPSMVIYADGERGPSYGCMACHESGTVVDLLRFLRSKVTGGESERRRFSEMIQIVEGDLNIEKMTLAQTNYKRLEKANKMPDSPSQTRKADAVSRVVMADGRVFYDYIAVAKSDALEPIDESVLTPYLGDVPAYARARGISDEAARAFQLGDDPRMKRLLFPVRDRKGRLIAISGRLYATACVRCGGRWARRCELCERFEEDHAGDEGALVCEDGRKFDPMAEECVKCGRVRPAKYLHSNGFKRNLILYGEHMTDETRDGRVYVVEGNIDAVKMWQYGYRPVVATLGGNVGEIQVEKIIARWRKAIVVGDGDESGRRMLADIKRLVAARIPVTLRGLDPGRDPGDMSADELLEKLGQPPTLLQH